MPTEPVQLTHAHAEIGSLPDLYGTQVPIIRIHLHGLDPGHAALALPAVTLTLEQAEMIVSLLSNAIDMAQGSAESRH